MENEGRVISSQRSGLGKATVLILALVLTVAFSLPVDAEARRRQQVVVEIATTSVGSEWYSIGMIMGAAMEEALGWMVTPQPQISTLVFPDILSRGQATFSFTSHIDNHFAYRGERQFEGKDHSDLRLVMGGSGFKIGVFSNGIKSFQDLKGKRWTWEMVGAGTINVFSKALMGALGTTPGDYRSLSAEHIGPGYRDLMEGRTDAASLSLEVGLIEEAALRTNITLILIDEALAGKIQQEVPFFFHAKTRRDYAAGGPAGTGLMAQAEFIQTSTRVDEEIVYTWLKTFYENWEKMNRAGPEYMVLWEAKQDVMLKKGGSPYHSGAVKFYKERGWWTEEMQAIQDQLLAIHD